MAARMKDNTVYTFNEKADAMSPPVGFSKDWKGFWRSEESFHSRYKAKCSFCKSTISGRVEFLIEHKTKKCRNRNNWPEDLRRPFKRDAPIPAASSGPLAKFVKIVDKQSEVDQNFFKALVSTSIPFSCVDVVYFRRFFESVGVKIPNRWVNFIIIV